MPPLSKTSRRSWTSPAPEAGVTKDTRLHDARHTSGTLLGNRSAGKTLVAVTDARKPDALPFTPAWHAGAGLAGGLLFAGAGISVLALALTWLHLA